jgi:hypothetical protein
MICQRCKTLLTWEEELCVSYLPEDGELCSACLYDLDGAWGVEDGVGEDFEDE